MTVTVEPINVLAAPVVMSATVADPLDVDVSSPAPVVVDVSAVALSATVADSLSVTVALPGPQGIAGAAGTSTITRTTAQALSGHRAVTADDDGRAVYASADVNGHISRPVWLTTGAWDADVTATLTTEGTVAEPTWNWTPGLPIWLGIDGLLTQTIPPGAVFIRRVAEVIDSTTIDFGPGDAIAVI